MREQIRAKGHDRMQITDYAEKLDRNDRLPLQTPLRNLSSGHTLSFIPLHHVPLFLSRLHRSTIPCGILLHPIRHRLAPLKRTNLDDWRNSLLVSEEDHLH